MSQAKSHGPVSAPHGHPGYETRDLPARPVVVSLVVGTLVIVLIFVAMYALTAAFGEYVRRTAPPPNPLAAAAPKEPPAPRLQPAPAKDLAELRAWEDGLLHGYAWVDKTNGIVRIPIERAIELVAERGLPARVQEGR